MAQHGVRIVILNLTSVPTGHDWRFAVNWPMPPFDAIAAILPFQQLAACLSLQRGRAPTRCAIRTLRPVSASGSSLRHDAGACDRHRRHRHQDRHCRVARPDPAPLLAPFRQLAAIRRVGPAYPCGLHRSARGRSACAREDCDRHAGLFPSGIRTPGRWRRQRSRIARPIHLRGAVRAVWPARQRRERRHRRRARRDVVWCRAAFTGASRS